MKSLLRITVIFFGITLLCFLFIWYNNQTVIEYYKNGTYDENVKVAFKHRFLKLGMNTKCKLFNEQLEIQGDLINNNCILSAPPGTYELTIVNEDKDINLKNKEQVVIQELKNFEIEQDKIYLINGEAEKLNYTSETEPIIWEYDDEIISLNDGIITGLKDGKTTIIGKNEDGVTDTIDIEVTSLLSKQTNFNFEKEFIGCKQYSNEEAKLLDDILEYKINKAGYKTRAGVVEAARFLTLSFQYRIPYFFENGRLHWSGVHYIDGEGRYYHKGLYLSTDKYESIGPRSKEGPVMWGCNLRDRDGSAYVLGAPYPNGLDCSGFVTWALLNGGFDVGDVGANGYPLLDEKRYYSDVFIPVTLETLNSGKEKPGDIIAISGHTALIVGIDDEHYYVAESTVKSKGVVINTYTKKELTKNFTYIHLMDEIYKEDGNLTMMW